MRGGRRCAHVASCACLRRGPFTATLLRGDKTTLISVLAYTLSRFPQLKKRAYVARYLMPIEVPPEFQHEESIVVGSSVLAFSM